MTSCLCIFALTSKVPAMLIEYLIENFRSWKPSPPIVEETTKRDVTLSFRLEPFKFLQHHLIYRVEKKEKLPSWVVVYSGGKLRKTIDNLAPSHPHRFRLKVIMKQSAMTTLADEAIEYFGDETSVYENIKGIIESDNKQQNSREVDKADSVNTIYLDKKPLSSQIFEGKLEKSFKFVESQYSEELWTSTGSNGTSVLCFCMAVSCGYIKQVQQMLEDRPELISIVNSSTGCTPLATAVRKGDVSMVRYLLSNNADFEQQSSNGQTPLMLAVLAGHVAVTELLLDSGADLRTRDVNGLRVEHYAVDSSSTKMVSLLLDRGGDVHVTDNNHWTPLFRAGYQSIIFLHLPVCQGASTSMIDLLVRRGSKMDITDRRQLSLVAAARLLTDRHGRRRESVLRLVDSQYHHEKVVANFTRLTKKITSVHTLLTIK